MSKPILFSDAAYLELSRPGEFQRFYQEYIELLERKLQRIALGGTDQFYFTCGEIHDRCNKNWNPFYHLWTYAAEKGLDFYSVKDMIEERLGREIICEKKFDKETKAARNEGILIGGEQGERDASQKGKLECEKLLAQQKNQYHFLDIGSSPLSVSARPRRERLPSITSVPAFSGTREPFRTLHRPE